MTDRMTKACLGRRAASGPDLEPSAAVSGAGIVPPSIEMQVHPGRLAFDLVDLTLAILAAAQAGSTGHAGPCGSLGTMIHMAR